MMRILIQKISGIRKNGIRHIPNRKTIYYVLLSIHGEVMYWGQGSRDLDVNIIETGQVEPILRRKII